MDSKLINRVCGFILNLRHMGFNASAWPDIQAAVGELSAADKVTLGKAFEAAGGAFRGKVWTFDTLDIDALRASPVDAPAVPVKLVTLISVVPAGTWGRDINGRIKFVKNPNYHFGIGNNEDDNDQNEDDDPDESSYFDSPRKGKLDLDL